MPSSSDCATLQAIFEGVDQARQDAEAEWGAARLPLLVDDELRAKLYRQKVRWSEAYQAAWAAEMLTRDHLDAVTKAAGGMKRAWTALAEAAVEAGHRPLKPDVWEVMLADGSVAAIVRTSDEAANVIASGRQVAVYSLTEIANIIDALPEALKVAKVVFPGATFLPPHPDGLKAKGWVKDGDPIPFGDAA
jgi:hypothetical protein